MEVSGFVAASPREGINGISMVPFPELLSMFDVVVDGFDVVSFNSMFIGFSSIQQDIIQEHFTPETLRFTCWPCNMLRWQFHTSHGDKK